MGYGAAAAAAVYGWGRGYLGLCEKAFLMLPGGCLTPRRSIFLDSTENWKQP